MVTSRRPPREQFNSATSRTPPRGAALYLLGAALLALIILAGLLRYPDRVVALGLVGGLYYLILLLVPLPPAFLLFRYLDSFGEWTGSLSGGKLKLRGAAALYFALVLLGSLHPPQPPSFSTTVYLYGPSGHQDLILRGSGQVFIDTGSLRRRQPIGADGEAVFLEIPASFLGKKVPVALDADGFELADPNPTVQLDKGAAYVEVRRKPGRIKGYVKDDEGRPLPGVTLTLAGLTASSTESGYFEFTIPGDKLQPSLTLKALSPGFVPWSDTVVPNSNDVEISMHRER
jgi:hypothetical protein